MTILAMALGIGLLQIILDKGQEADWFASRAILALTVVAVVCLIGIVVGTVCHCPCRFA